MVPYYVLSYYMYVIVILTKTTNFLPTKIYYSTDFSFLTDFVCTFTENSVALDLFARTILQNVLCTISY